MNLVGRMLERAREDAPGASGRAPWSSRAASPVTRPSSDDGGPMSAPAPSVSPELKALMRRLKLGRLLDTLPERLALARSHDLAHLEFLEQLFSDEVHRRDADSAGLRARKAKLDPTMILEAWDETAQITYDHAVWAELVALRFVEQPATPSSWGRSGWARPSWPPPSATSPAAGGSASTSSGPTSCSSA